MADLIGPPPGAPPKPESSTCATCGKVVEPVWIPAIAKPRWWVPQQCCDCLALARAEDQQREADKSRREWLRGRVERAGLAGLRREQTFAAVRPAPGTRSALSAAQQFAKACTLDELPRRGLLLVGENGSGKTLLATAVLNYVLDQNDSATVLFVRFSDYLLRLREAFGDREGWAASDLREVMAAVDVLALDDLGAAAMARSEWDGEELARLLEEREVRRLPIVATCDLSERELQGRLGKRIVSRLFGMCRVVPMADGEVEAGDYRRRGR